MEMEAETNIMYQDNESRLYYFNCAVNMVIADEKGNIPIDIITDDCSHNFCSICNRILDNKVTL